MHKLYAVLAALLSACIFLAGCAGVPEFEHTTDPVLLLPEEAEMYAALYTAENKQVLETVFESVLPAEQVVQANKILSYTTEMYAAVDTVSENITLVAKGDFPVSVINLALSNKGGWSKVSCQIAGTKKKQTYYMHESGIQVAFPSKKLCIASFTSVLEPLEVLFGGSESVSDDLRLVSSWINDNCTQETPCALFSSSPEKLIAAILGPKITFGIKTTGMALTPVESGYSGNMEITLLDERAQPAAVFILKAVSLLLSGNNPVIISTPDKERVLLENITISTDSMIKLIGSVISDNGF